MKKISTPGGLLLVLALAACTAPVSDDGAAPAAPSAPSSSRAREAGADAEQTAGTVVRFSAVAASVDVTIGEANPAVRDFLAMLPMTIELEEFAGREKIGHLPRKLRYDGAPGSDPEDGDLIYFVPWGNIGFYYDTAGIGYSDQTIHLGTYDATRAQLERLEGQQVTVEVVERVGARPG